jgi:hypothetical protein
MPSRRAPLRASPSIAAKLREAEEELERLEAQASTPPAADIERLIPRLAEEIERAVRELPKTLAAGNLDLARQKLKGLVGSIRVVAKPTEMLLYSETGFFEAALKRAAGGMASINGSGGAIPAEPAWTARCSWRREEAVNLAFLRQSPPGARGRGFFVLWRARFEGGEIEA